MVNFVLTALNDEITMLTSATLPSESPDVLTTDATAELQVSLDDMKSVFQYQTDASDITNADATDIKYYVNPSAWPSLNPANAVVKLSPILSADKNGNLLDEKMMIAHDFIRHIAKGLFNTAFGVDLFDNELELLNNIRELCDGSNGHVWNNISSSLTAVSKTAGTDSDLTGDAGDKYFTNAVTDAKNLSYHLLRQLIDSDATRLANLPEANSADGLRPIPFDEDDSISFSLTVNPAAGQEGLTGVSAIDARKYQVKLVFKTSPSNVSVAADEV